MGEDPPRFVLELKGSNINSLKTHIYEYRLF
uniref:Uncharacterized protein n=1 Tax=Podoviridae sp. ctDwO1 TaxID=2827726 RepID=A0A8S5TBU5_9CAUD|nr:MAG TPA: hypothetical protein [Podoviridae sp. ctDwO1]